MTGKRWFAVQTRGKMEYRVRDLLSLKRYECFVPSYKVTRRWSDRVVTLEQPLFSGYVFCSCEPHVTSKAVTTNGVIRVVGFGGEAAQIPVAEIQALQRLAATDVMREPWRYLPEGCIVRLESGALKGVEGILCETGNRKAMVVSVTLLQRSVAVHLNDDVKFSVIAKPPSFSGTSSATAAVALSILRGS